MTVDYPAACAAVLHAVPAAAAAATAAIDPQPYAAGEPVGIDRSFRPADGPLWLGFIDLEPGRNWGHRALTVVVHGDGRVEVTDAQFPPAFVEGRRLRPIGPADAGG